jgi:hypothetical protein
MQHVDGLGELSHIEHASFSQDMYSNLPDAGAYLFHGFPVRRLQTTLNKSQFKTRCTPGFCRKIPEVVETGTDELQGFHVQNYISFFIPISINLDKAFALAGRCWTVYIA